MFDCECDAVVSSCWCVFVIPSSAVECTHREDLLRSLFLSVFLSPLAKHACCGKLEGWDKRRTYLEALLVLNINADPISAPVQDEGQFPKNRGNYGKDWRMVGRRKRSRRKYHLRPGWPRACGSSQRQRTKEGGALTRQLVEDMNTICVRLEDNHVWVSGFKLVLQEHKMLGLQQNDIEVPCVWQSVVLWF